MDYFNIIEMMQSYWKEELEDINSPFYKNTEVKIRARPYFKRWGDNISLILRSMEKSIIKKQKWYYTERSLANHFKIPKSRISTSIKLICQNLGMVLIKLPIRSEFDHKGKRQSPIWRFFLAPPNLTKLLRTNSNFPIDQFRFKVLLTNQLNIENHYEIQKGYGLCDKRGDLCDKGYGINLSDQDSCGFAALPSMPSILTTNNISIVYSLLSTNCFAVSIRREQTTNENKKPCFRSIDSFFENQKSTGDLVINDEQSIINKEQTMKSKRQKLKSTHVVPQISLPPQRAFGEKKTFDGQEDSKPARIKLTIKNNDSQTTLLPQKSLEKGRAIDPQKAVFRTAKELLAANRQLEADKALVKERMLSTKTINLPISPSQSDIVKSVTRVTTSDYGIKKGKVYTVNNNFGRWIVDTLDWVEDCNIPPIDTEQVLQFQDYWNSVDNQKFINKSLKIGGNNFNYLRLALTYRLVNHDLTFTQLLTAVDTFAYLSNHKQLKYKLTKIDPLKHFLYNSPKSKNWFEICIKPKFEAAKEVCVKTTEWTLSFNKVLNLFAKHFYGGNNTLAENEVTRYYSDYIDWINFLVAEHKGHCIAGGIKFEPFLESFFEFLGKFKKGPKYRPSLKGLADPINLNHYYGQMIEETGDPDYVLPWKIVLARRKKHDAIQAEYDRLHPENQD